MDKGRAKELEIYANKLFAEDLRQERLESEQKRQEQFKLFKEREVASEQEKSAMLSGSAPAAALERYGGGRCGGCAGPDHPFRHQGWGVYL